MVSFATSPPPPSTKMNNVSIVYKQQNLQTLNKFQDPPPLPCGHHKCIVPYLAVFTVLLFYLSQGY